MKKIVFAGALLLTMFTACKKDKDDQSTAEKIAGKWNVSKIITREVIEGEEPFEDTYTGVSTDYIEFRSDGKVVLDFDGDSEIESYQVMGDTAIVIADVPFKITALSKSQLSLYSKQSYSNNYF
ncbi:MAG: hypothetical protein ABWZ25_16960, partial [Chitinophagaceae bacterium]